MLSLVAWTELSTAASPLLLAARRSYRGAGMSWVVVGALAVAAIVALWLFSRWWMKEGALRMRNSPRALFAELCRAHALVSSERQLLWALAECRQLAQPGELFVNPSHFDEGRLSATLAARKGELRALRGRLFAGLDEKPSVAASHGDAPPENPSLADAAAGEESAQNAAPALN